jgi:hypothetical protein
MMIEAEHTTPEAVEADGRYAQRVFSVAYLGTPSSASLTGSHAIAGLINWWADCEPTPLEQLLTDVDDLIKVLQAFRAAVQADPTMLRPMAATHEVVDFGDGPLDETRGYPFSGNEPACSEWVNRHQKIRPDGANRYAVQEIPEI